MGGKREWGRPQRHEEIPLAEKPSKLGRAARGNGVCTRVPVCEPTSEHSCPFSSGFAQTLLSPLPMASLALLGPGHVYLCVQFWTQPKV